MGNLVLSFALLFLQLSTLVASSQKIVKSLPGYPGTLPFKLETGYVSVGERDEIQLFYYFIESQGNPRLDPLILWHSGGPGCSSFTGLIYEMGPLIFDVENFDGSFPSLLLRMYDWTKLSSIIFIDSPPVTGFSYDTTKGYRSSDTGNAKMNYEFLRKWMSSHPSFTRNPLYIAGDSYGGKTAVLVAYEVAKGIVRGHQPRLALQGYITGNSRNDVKLECNGRVPYAHGMALISDELFELAKEACNGEYFHPDTSNITCMHALRNIRKCLDPINVVHILEPKCDFPGLRINKLRNTKCMPYIEDDPPASFIFMPKGERFSCRSQYHVLSYIWANDPAVQEALGVRNGTVSYWKRCQRDFAAEAHIHDVANLQRMNRFLSDQGYRSLAYSGDHDLGMPYTCTLQWIRQLNLSLCEEWRPWNVNGQVAGYTMTYKNGETLLTFATIKGAGHTAPEYKPQECYAMLDRWLSSFPL